MKKSALFLIATAIVFTIAVKPASAGFYIAPKAQVAYGFTDMHTDGDINPGLGGGVILGFGVMNMIAVEANAAAVYWFTESSDVTYLYFPIHVGAKVSFMPLLGFVGGIGFTTMYSKVLSVSNTDSYFSLYAGIEISLAGLFIRPQLYYVASDKASVSGMLEVGYRF